MDGVERVVIPIDTTGLTGITLTPTEVEAVVRVERAIDRVLPPVVVEIEGGASGLDLRREIPLAFRRQPRCKDSVPPGIREKKSDKAKFRKIKNSKNRNFEKSIFFDFFEISYFF